MKGNGIKIFFIVLLLCLTTFEVFPWKAVGIDMPYSAAEYKLGLDLHGGVELDYRIDLDEAKKKSDYNEANVVEGLKSIVEKRVNSLGTAEPTILTANYGNESHIIVQIPSSNYAGQNLSDEQIREKNNEYIAKAKDTIGRVVRLEFKEKKTQITDADRTERKQIAENIKKDLDSGEFDFVTVANKYKDQYENVAYLTGTETSIDSLPQEIRFQGIADVKVPFTSDIIETEKAGGYTLGANGTLEQGQAEKGFAVVRINSLKKVDKERDVTTGTGASATKKKEKYTDTILSYQALFISQKPSDWTAAKTANGQVLDERYLIKASTNLNNGLQPQVELTFNPEGTKIFAELTKRLLGQQLAIYVGGEQLTAPTVQSVIPDGKAVITGNYTIDSAKKLATDINTGIVPAPIYLTSERTIDAKIGGDSLKVIINAGLIGFILILIFLISIYRFSGVLAGIALFVYITLTIAIVKLSGVVLTLASIAGLVLSIGLAIDANILIFERSKEELRQKMEIHKALHIGFDRSWSAIWDAHVTSFVSAVILYLIGVNLIKGFGLMLGIGIIVSLFSAMWISRVLVMAFAPRFQNNLRFFIGLKDKDNK